MAGTKLLILPVFNRHIPSILDVKNLIPSFNGKHFMKPFRVFLEHPTYNTSDMTYKIVTCTNLHHK